MATKRGKNKAKPKRRNRIGSAVQQINTRRAYQRAYDAFFEDNNPDQALTLLKQIDDQGHMSLEAMSLYLDVLHQLRDLDHYARIATMMAERCPEDPNANMMAASGAYETMQPVSAILFFERFLKLAPDHPGAPLAEKELAKLRGHLPKILDAFIDDLPKELPRIASVERILHVFKLGRFDDVIKRAEKHLQTYPADLRIRNNLAEALALKGDGKKALKIIDESIRLTPDNFFARAVRCRLTYFEGHAEESKADAKKLVNLRPRQISDLTKAAQSFALIGDEDKIRWAFEEAEQRNWLNDWPTDSALLTNYFATSLARAGDGKSANRLWKQAVKLAGEATTAHENLEDMRQPPGEQWGPAYFEPRDWLSQTQQAGIREIGGCATQSDDDDDDASSAFEAIGQKLRRFLARYPEVERSIPAMLDRGDAASQKLALMLARGSQRADIKQALLDYARGPRGIDEERRQLLTSLKEEGHVFESPMSFYVKGKVHQIEMLRFQIVDEPIIPEGRSDETCELVETAIEALHRGDGAGAEKLLRQVEQIEPDQPDVLNNLAVALEIQNRLDEAHVLIEEVSEKHPDYFFGKIAAANRRITHRQYDEALEILVELQRRKRLHSTEFYALAKSMINMYVGQREHASAQYWVDIWEGYDPDHPDLPSLKRYVASHQGAGRFLKQMLSMS